MRSQIVSATYPHRRTDIKKEIGGLDFRNITLADIPEISRLLQFSTSLTCDYTVGGIYMWVDYFRYEFCIFRNTLFIKGVSEKDITCPAFSLPIGAMGLDEAVILIRDYCRRKGQRMRFSAIPGDRLDEFMAIGDWEVVELVDWADYLYDISSLATLSGNRLAKKRNHVNRFMADHPGAQLVRIGLENIPVLKEAYNKWLDEEPLTKITAIEDKRMTFNVLDNFGRLPFEGAFLTDGCGGVAAFAIGEIVGETLFVHIEKMDHKISGAGETINKMFAAEMLAAYPDLMYVNREEDTGDAGLRYAKQSYHPLMLLPKYDLYQPYR